MIIDDLGGQLAELAASNLDAVVHRVRRQLNRRLLSAANASGALVFYLDTDRTLTEHITARKAVAWWEVPGPSKAEIAESLERVGAKTPLGLDNRDGVAEVLAATGRLREAMMKAARAFTQRGSVTLATVLDLPPVNESEVAEVMRELDGLVGLEELKTNLRGMASRAGARRQRLERRGELPEETLHLVFLGSAGTGKTTVARIVARLFHALGLLPKDQVKEVSSKDIRSEFDGETGTRMHAALRDAIGGVLFIDEAHQLASPHDAKAREALDVLVPMAWNHRSELVVILAGYADGVGELLRMDEGMPSRFPKARHFEFHDYTEPQLWEVLRRVVQRRNLTIDPAAEVPFRRLLATRARTGNFGNARGVGNLVEEICSIHDARAGVDDAVLGIDDLPARYVRHPEDLAEARREFEALIGLPRVKDAIEALRVELAFVDLVPDASPGIPRFRFVGPPGTGKTTVARLLGRLLYGMGLLERKKVVETTGAGLLAGFLGQTSDRVHRYFEDARGGVLFIDEVHGLVAGEQGNSYAEEARRTLVSELTNADNSGTVVVIAGYEREVNRLLSTDAGFQGRFPNELFFDPLTPDDCVAVARELVLSGVPPMTADDEFFDALRASAVVACAGEAFNNARWVNTEIRQATNAMKRRFVASAGASATTPLHLLAEDLTGRVEPRARTTTADFGAPPYVPQSPTLASPHPRGREVIAERVSELADSVLHLVVDAGDERRLGTGFVATDDHVIVTNHHVIEDASAIEVLLGPSRGSASGRVIRVDEASDLALVVVDFPNDVDPVVPLPLVPSVSLPPLHELVVFGNGEVRVGEEPRVVTARVGRNRRIDERFFETDGAIEEGFSGGPLYDPAQGGVVGVVHGGRGRGVKIAIRSENALALLVAAGYRMEDS